MIGHAVTISTISELWKALKDGNQECIESIVLAETKPFGSSQESRDSLAWAFWSGTENIEMYVSGPDETDATVTAKNMISAAINQNVNSQVSFKLRYLSTDVVDDFTFGQQWSSVLNLIYYTLAHQFSYGDVRRCEAEHCRGFFIPKRKNQIYCPSLPTTTGSRPQSQCQRIQGQRNSKFRNRS